MPAKLKVEVTNQEGIVVIKLIGEARLDIEAAAFALDRVVVHHPRNIVVDASELTFLSSLGMSLLVNLSRTAKQTGNRVKLAALQPLVEEALRHAALLPLFELHSDTASALAGIAG